MAAARFASLAVAASILFAAVPLFADDPPPMQKALQLFQAKKYDEAAAALEAIVQGDPSNGQALYSLGSTYWELGQADKALQTLMRADRALLPAGQTSLQSGVRFRIGRAYARLGDRDKAFEWIEKAVRIGWPNYALFKSDPDVARLEDDPRYRDLDLRLSKVTEPKLNPLLPVGLEVPMAPTPFRAHGLTTLVYELRIWNLSSQEMALQKLEVLDGAAGGTAAAPIASFEGKELKELFDAPFTDASVDRSAIGGRVQAIAWFWITKPADAPVPASLTHRLYFKSPVPGTGPMFLEGGATKVLPAARVIGPPMRGGLWVARWSGKPGYHRYAVNSIEGEVNVAQRFAIDWNRYEDGSGRAWRGEGERNEDQVIFGSEVVAVADGVIAQTKDGIADNVLSEPVPPPTFDDVAGNFVSLDIGDGAFATYFHLKRGSVRVKPGDRVKRGQVLAQVGNTGNATGPHLHFHVATSPRAMKGEGIPYVIDAYEELGYDTPEAAQKGEWHPAPGGGSALRRDEMPIDGAVVRFR